MAINASLLVCDDVRVEINGKVLLIGVYTGNVNIPPMDNVITSQLCFMFSIDSLVSEVPNSVTFQVTLPGDEPLIAEMSISAPEFRPEHTRWILRHVMGKLNAPLRPGKIIAKVSVDGTDVPISSPWIEVAESVNPDPNAPQQPSEQSLTTEQLQGRSP